MQGQKKLDATDSKNIFYILLLILLGNRSIKISTASISYCIIGLMGILSVIAIGYFGGYFCNAMFMPLVLFSYIILFYSIIMLIYALFRAFKTINKIHIPIISLVILISSIVLFFHIHQPLYFYLHGLDNRFKTQFGYETMREFAKEIVQKPEGIVSDSSLAEDPRYSKDQSKRKAMAKKYPFLGWHKNAGGVYIMSDIVELTWGSPLTGHWGFQVALNSKVRSIEKGQSLKVADDIQFVYYYD